MSKDTHIRKSFSETAQVSSICPQTGFLLQNTINGIVKIYIYTHTQNRINFIQIIYLFSVFYHFDKLKCDFCATMSKTLTGILNSILGIPQIRVVC